MGRRGLCETDPMEPRRLAGTRANRSAALLGAATALLLTLAACSSGGDLEIIADDSTPTPAPTAEPTAPPDAEPTTAPEPQPEATPTPDATPTPEATPTASATATPSMPGEPFDFLVPADGEVVGVIGVAFDDILEIHELPGENTPLVGELPNLADDVEGTGEGRQLPNSIWWRIRWQGIDGWVGSGFMARLGDTFDITSEVITQNGNNGMGAETMLDLGMMVADLRKSTEPASRIVVVVAPTVSDDLIGEITIDVVGLGDDAVRGERLHVFGDGFDQGGEGFSLDAVEMTLLCARGVTDDGLCT